MFTRFSLLALSAFASSTLLANAAPSALTPIKRAIGKNSVVKVNEHFADTTTFKTFQPESAPVTASDTSSESHPKFWFPTDKNLIYNTTIQAGEDAWIGWGFPPFHDPSILVVDNIKRLMNASITWTDGIDYDVWQADWSVVCDYETNTWIALTFLDMEPGHYVVHYKVDVGTNVNPYATPDNTTFCYPEEDYKWKSYHFDRPLDVLPVPQA